MKPWVTIAKSGALVLQEHDGEYVIRVNGHELMSSRRNQSEIAMAKWAKGRKRVLIGGLGLGCTLRAVLELVDREARVVVSELEPAVVEWHRDLLKLKGLEDPRVTVHVGDVAAAEGKFDCILLDVDNGPNALTDPRNSKLYGPAGVARFRQMLKARGVYVVWSAREEQQFIKLLGRGGFSVEVEKAEGGVLFVATPR